MLRDQKIEIGQVWRVKGKNEQPDIDAIVRRVDAPTELIPESNASDTLIIGIEISAPGEWPNVGHLPVHEIAFRSGTTTLLTGAAPEEGESFEDGYQQWLTAYQSGEAGVFELPLCEVYSLVIGAVSNDVENGT